MPRPTSLPENERPEQVFADHEAEDMGDHCQNQLSALREDLYQIFVYV
jgi:hypothetical protein